MPVTLPGMGPPPGSLTGGLRQVHWCKIQPLLFSLAQKGGASPCGVRGEECTSEDFLRDFGVTPVFSWEIRLPFQHFQMAFPVKMKCQGARAWVSLLSNHCSLDSAEVGSRQTLSLQRESSTLQGLEMDGEGPTCRPRLLTTVPSPTSPQGAALAWPLRACAL